MNPIEGKFGEGKWWYSWGTEQGETVTNYRNGGPLGRDYDGHRPFYAGIFFYFSRCSKTEKTPDFRPFFALYPILPRLFFQYRGFIH